MSNAVKLIVGYKSAVCFSKVQTISTFATKTTNFTNELFSRITHKNQQKLG